MQGVVRHGRKMILTLALTLTLLLGAHATRRMSVTTKVVTVLVAIPYALCHLYP